MIHEITDHVPGLSRAEVDTFIREAEGGFDVAAFQTEPNPHHHVPVVPSDLLEAIGRRAAQTGATPDEVVRQALVRYLDSA